MIVTRNFSLHRIILLSIGLWPYQRSKLVQLQIIFCFGIMISNVVYQFAVFVSADCTVHLFFKVLSTSLHCFLFVIEYNSFLVNRQTIKLSLEQLQDVYNELKDKKEIDIMKKYGDNVKRRTTMLLLYHTFILTATVLLLLMLHIRDVVLRINEFHLSQMIQKLIPKHFVGRENHYYLVFLYWIITNYIGGIVIIATGMMLIACAQHGCGMFRIASYRIEKAMMINTLKSVNMKNKTIMYIELIHAIEIHRKAIKFTLYLYSEFQYSRFVSIIIAVIFLSLNLYEVSDAILLENDMEDCFLHSTFVIFVFLYLFLSNYYGQIFTDCNDYVFSTAYNIRWYKAPLHVQKLILFLLWRGSKTVSLNYGIIFKMSLEFFATLTKASISYFAVVYTIVTREVDNV